MYAVVRIAGKQYRISEGQTVVVNRIEGKIGDTVTFTDVLLLTNGTVQVGTPTVAGASVTAKILGQGKGEKIHVRRFKSKVRYRRKKGFRPLETTVQILTIGVS